MKTGYLSDAVKILIFAAAIIITCILVWIGFSTANIAKSISGSAITQMGDLNNDIKDGDIMAYDGTDVYGSEVINFIKKQLGDYPNGQNAPIYINVQTIVSNNTYTNNVYFDNIKNFTDSHYIKPTAVFSAHVVKNTNKVIVGVTFNQK